MNDRPTSWQRKITMFFTGQSVSLLGSTLVQYAIVWYITNTSNSGLWVTLSAISGFAPQIFITLFAGVWADRYNRKHLIMLADGGIAVFTLLLSIIMFFGYREMWMLIVILAIRSVGSGLQSPAVTAMIPQLVPNEHFMRVNGINGTIQSLVSIAAPAIGGTVLSFGRLEYVLFIDVATAVIGIALLWRINIPPHIRAANGQKPDYFTDLKQGIRFALNNYFVRRLLALYVLFTVFLVTPAFLNGLMVRREFVPDSTDLEYGYRLLTITESAFLIGAGTGGLLISAWGGFKNRLHTLGAGTILFGLAAVLGGVSPQFWMFVACMAVAGFAVPSINTPVTALLQQKVGNDMYGRVYSLFTLTFSAVMPFGMAIFGPLADYISIRWLMVGSGVMMVVLTLIVFRMRKFVAEGIVPTAPVPAQTANQIPIVSPGVAPGVAPGVDSAAGITSDPAPNPDGAQ